MRKVTPEERRANLLAKEAHVHSADCDHGAVEEAVAEPVEVVAEVVTEEAEPVEEASTVAETPAEEAVVEGKSKKKSTPKY